MSGETSVKFLIPDSSCEKDFEVWALFANETKASVLRCDWVKKYYCDSAPGYTHTLENRTALITVPRDLEKKPEDFICDSLFRPTTDPIRCLCKRAAISPGQSDSDSPGQVGLIAGVSALVFLLLLLLVGLFIDKYCYRQNSSESEQNPNVRPDECKPLKQNSHLDSPNPLTPPPTAFSTIKKETSEASIPTSPALEETRMDSQRSSTTTLTCFSCGAVQPKEKPTIHSSDSKL